MTKKQTDLMRALAGRIVVQNAVKQMRVFGDN